MVARYLGTQRTEGETVPEEEVMRRCGRRRGVGPSRRADAEPVAEIGDDPRLVEGDPPGYTVAECSADDRRVLGEVLGGLPPGPASGILERLGEIPVVERDHRLYPAVEQASNQSPVVIEALVIHRAGAGRLDSGPGDGESVGAHSELAQQVQVRAKPVVGVAGDVPGVTPAHLSRRAAESVPDGRPATAFLCRSFPLVGGASHPP